MAFWWDIEYYPDFQIQYPKAAGNVIKLSDNAVSQLWVFWFCFLSYLTPVPQLPQPPMGKG